MNCGSGLNYSITFICTGSNCTEFERLLGVTCQNDSSSSIKCSNDVACADPSNITSSFSIQRPVDANFPLSQTQNISFGTQQYVVTGSGSNFSYVNATTGNTTSSTTPQTTSVRSAAAKRQPPRRSLLLGMCLVILVIFATPVLSQTTGNTLLNEFNAAFSSVAPVLLGLEKELCDELLGDVLNDLVKAGEAAVELQLGLQCFKLLTVAELEAGGEIAIALPFEGEAVAAIAAVTNTALCLTLVGLMVQLTFSQGSSQAASPFCEAVTSALSPGTTTISTSPSPASSTTATGLAPIPTITATSGPAGAILCYLNGYFQDLNETTLPYCSPPQLDYYVPAKYLVRYFCDPSVASIQPSALTHARTPVNNTASMPG